MLLDVFTNPPDHKLIGNWAFNVLTSSDIVSLPLFILMGELLFRTRLSQSLFTGHRAMDRASCRAGCCTPP